MDHFSIKALEKERIFLKKHKDRKLRTLLGKENAIVEVTKTAVLIKSENGEKPFKVSRDRLRAAMRELFYRRSISRTDLGVFCNYNSALMALLMAIFVDIAKVRKTIRYGFRLVLKGIRFFPAGADRAPRDLEIAVANGIRFVLLSFYHLKDDKTDRWKYHVKRLGLKVLLDSGEFSRYRAILQGKTPKSIRIEEYAEFVRKHKDVLFGYFNMDVIGNAAQSRENELFLLETTGISPIPIWHCQSPIEELDALVEMESPVIAVGGSVFLSESERKKVFDEAFARHSEVDFHWLGGSSTLLHEYDWFSADSSGWLAGRKYRRLITPNGQVKAPDTWTNEECLAYNAKYLAGLEDPIGVQFSGMIAPKSRCNA